MSQLNSLFNAIVIAALAGAVLFFAIAPKPPKPLPDNIQFLSQVQRPGIVVVKFGAPWCPPCRQIEGELDQLALSSAGKIAVVKIDVDQQQSLAGHYGISSIPHLLLFKDGKQVAEAKGYRSRDQLEQWVASKR
jgi:thioredoxin